MNIQTLIHQLSVSDKKDYSRILKNFDIDKLDFSEVENWLPNSYTRNCFYRDQYFELILICWDEDQQTEIHDHDGEDCWVYILEGEMEEDFYKLDNVGKLKLCSTNIIKHNQLTRADKFSEFHRLRNNSGKRALSLHLYAKPIEQSLTYDETLGVLTKKKLRYDTYKPLNTLAKIN